MLNLLSGFPCAQAVLEASDENPYRPERMCSAVEQLNALATDSIGVSSFV
jgi:hypothetical protein